ncbi:hypothetical protein CONLIGDRAFT_648958 [Coniochaeta ligniaria NRRL 30616]|uniref:Uncharacterized protein n=1 Tax=Coniochaeta ligniaria NRRL 30616 TaxID=1408157 RepID=A0A1J7I9N2_9PEZI|nr:hypothetical protein CONLIGDRAFT_648958 [Coniochaeta ligniaria NRRL 30616]
MAIAQYGIRNGSAPMTSEEASPTAPPDLERGVKRLSASAHILSVSARARAAKPCHEHGDPPERATQAGVCTVWDKDITVSIRDQHTDIQSGQNSGRVEASSANSGVGHPVHNLISHLNRTILSSWQLQQLSVPGQTRQYHLRHANDVYGSGDPD